MPLPPVKAGWNDIWRRIAISRRRNLSMRKIRPQVEPGYSSTVLESTDKTVHCSTETPWRFGRFRRARGAPCPPSGRRDADPRQPPALLGECAMEKAVVIGRTDMRFGFDSFPSIPRYYGRNPERDCAIKCIQNSGETFDVPRRPWEGPAAAFYCFQSFGRLAEGRA